MDVLKVAFKSSSYKLSKKTVTGGIKNRVGRGDRIKSRANRKNTHADRFVFEFFAFIDSSVSFFLYLQGPGLFWAGAGAIN